MYKYEVCIKYARFAFIHLGDSDKRLKIKRFDDLNEVVDFINTERLKNAYFDLRYIKLVKVGEKNE